MSCRNAIAPLQLPIINNTVTSDGRTVSRGIEFGIGTPQQIISLGISLSDSDTFVFNRAQCNSSSEAMCAGRLGGMYDAEESDSYRQVTRAQWNGTTDKDLFTATSYIFFQERIQYGSNVSADGFPLFMSSSAVEAQGGMGLGNDSTILTHTHDSLQSPSTAYGYYAGARNIQAPEDGLLVIGGWDTARVDGELIEMEYSDDCPTCVVVESLTYNTPDGTAEPLLDAPLICLIEAAVRVLYLPQAPWERFNNITGATLNATNDYLTMPPEAPLGNLTLKLTNGYESTIPANELFTKPRDYNEAGEYEIIDHDTTLVQLQNASLADLGLSDADYGVLGLIFLSQNYIVMDHARKQWKIGKAKADGGNRALGTAIEPVIESICPEDDARISSGEGGGSNAGAIAGGVVGGVLGLALIIFGIWFYRRLQRKKTAAASAAPTTTGPTEMAASDEENASPPAYEKDPKKPAATGADGGPVEMSPTDQSDPRYNMSELPSSRDIDGNEGQNVQELPVPVESSETESGERSKTKAPVELP